MRLTTDLQKAFDPVERLPRARSASPRNLINLIKPKRLVTVARAPYAQAGIKKKKCTRVAIALVTDR